MPISTSMDPNERLQEDLYQGYHSLALDYTNHTSRKTTQLSFTLVGQEYLHCEVTLAKFIVRMLGGLFVTCAGFRIGRMEAKVFDNYGGRGIAGWLLRMREFQEPLEISQP